MNVNFAQPLVQVRGLCKQFGELKVLENISVDIHKGDVVFVVGPSGSGKSTFLRCLNRLEESTLQIRKPILICTGRRWGWYSSSLIYSLIWIL